MARMFKVSSLRREYLKTNKARFAVLGDNNGRVYVPNKLGRVYVRFEGGIDANGVTQYSSPVEVYHEIGADYYPVPNQRVRVKYDEYNNLVVTGADKYNVIDNGMNPSITNSLAPENNFLYLQNIIPLKAIPQGTATTASTLVTVMPLVYDHYNDYQVTSTIQVDLASYVPIALYHRIVILWLDTYTNTVTVSASTSQTIATDIDSTDIDECFADRPADGIPIAGFRLQNAEANVTQSNVYEDYRQFLNVPPVIGYANPLTYNTRIRSGYTLDVYGDYYAVDATLYAYGTLLNVGAQNSVDASTITGILPVKNGGTGSDMSGTGGTSFVVKQSSVGGAFTSALITSTELTTALTTPPDIGTTTPALGYFSKVGVNDTPSATEQLAVRASSATVVPVAIQADASQSANLLNVLNSGGTVLTSVSSAGNLMVRSTVNPTGSFGVGGNPSSLTTFQMGLVYAPTATSGTTGGIAVQSIASPSGTMTGANYALHFQSGTASGNVNNWTSASGGLIGIIGDTFHRGSGTITAGIAFAINNPAISGGGAITTFYGLKIASLTSGGTNYAIFTQLGLNELGDQLKINGAVDRVQLVVEGHSTQTTNLQEWQTSASVVVASVNNSGGAVFNENGTSTGDVRIEGDTDANLLFTDASADSVGVKTATPNSRLQINGSLSLPIVSKSADYTATIDDYTIVFTASATLNLPTAVGIAGRVYVVKSGSGVTVTIDPNGTETIDGNLTHSSTSLKAHQIQSDGANWWIISQY